jgi:hypothetical protein
MLSDEKGADQYKHHVAGNKADIGRGTRPLNPRKKRPAPVEYATLRNQLD